MEWLNELYHAASSPDLAKNSKKKAKKKPRARLGKLKSASIAELRKFVQAAKKKVKHRHRRGHAASYCDRCGRW
jgi:hypothetical protein